MPIRFAINGLGRIGRALVRIARERPEIEWVAANDPVPVEILARLLARDTVHGPFAGEVAVAPKGDALLVDGRRIPVFGETSPERIPWGDTGARVVVEASGRFLARDEAARHLSPEQGPGRGGGVERVVLTANAPEADVTLCLGLNEGDYDPRRHRVVSNASCTTNCAAPMLAVLDRRFGVRRALMSTVHSYTVNQRLVDRPHADPRRARAAAVNIIPTATTAPEALGRVLPAVAGRVEGMAVRVPTPAVAMLDLVADLEAETSAVAVRGAFREAAAGPLGRVLAASDEELVSSDFVGSPMSVTVDLPLVQVAGGGLARVVGWYDNEWGYSHRLADLVALVGETADEPRETAAPAHATRARTNE